MLPSSLRRAAVVAVSALALATLAAAPAHAASSQPAVSPGIYLFGAPWAAPGDRVTVAFADAGCAPGTISATWKKGSTSQRMETAGFGGFDWGDGRDYFLPTGISGSGVVRIACSDEADRPIVRDLPLTIRSSDPSSIYHSATQWSLLSSTATFSMLGFTPGETVRVAFYDQSLFEAGWDYASALANPVTTTADGHGAITAKVTKPGNWSGSDVNAIITTSTSRRIFDTSQTSSEGLGSSPTITVPSTATRGGSLTVGATGYGTSEKVTVALHSAGAPALVLGTLTSTSSGRVSGSVTIPSGTATGSYRVWIGSKSKSYLLQNAAIKVNAAFTAGKPTISGTAQVGKTLTAKPGTWKPTPSFTYQWLRNGSSIKDATKSTYKLTSSDRGKKITVKVTATKSGYTTKTATSASTSTVG